MGMKLCLADLAQEALDKRRSQNCAARRSITVPTDVSKLDEVQRLQGSRPMREFGEVAVLMNNAGTSPAAARSIITSGGSACSDVNLWGVINGVQAFARR